MTAPQVPCAVCHHDVTAHLTDDARCSSSGCECRGFRVEMPPVPEVTEEQAAAWWAEIERLPTDEWVVTPAFTTGFTAHRKTIKADGVSLHIESAPVFDTQDEVRRWLGREPPWDILRRPDA